MTFYLFANLGVVTGYYVLIGRHLQRRLGEHTLAAFFILAPAGLCAFAVMCFAATLAATLMSSASLLFYLIVPFALLPLCATELKLVFETRNPAVTLSEMAGFLLSACFLYPILHGCYQSIVNPSLDHDISQYIGYSQDILRAIPNWDVGLNWQAVSEFKIPHTNLYPSVLVWASLASGPADIFTDSHIKLLPLFYSVALISSVIAYCCSRANKLGLMAGTILILAVPHLEYVVTAISVDGFYLAPLVTVFFMVRNENFTHELTGLLSFMLLSHSLGAIYASFFYAYCIFILISKKSYPVRGFLFTSAVLASSLLPIVLASSWNQDLGFHYQYYSDPIVSSDLIGIGVNWQKDLGLLQWISAVFKEYEIVIFGLLGILFLGSNLKAVRLSEVSLLYIFFLMTLYCLTLLPVTELLGKAFQANFRYSLGLKLLALLCLFEFIETPTSKLLVGAFLVASCLYFYMAGAYVYEKYLYRPGEASTVQSIVSVCRDLRDPNNLTIITSDIRINRLCDTDYAFIFSRAGLEALRECKDGECLFLSRRGKRFSDSAFMEGGQLFELRPNTYSLTGTILAEQQSSD